MATVPSGVSPKRTIPPYVDPAGGGGGGSDEPLWFTSIAGAVGLAVGDAVQITPTGCVKARAVPGSSVVAGIIRTGPANDQIGDAITVYLAGEVPATFDLVVQGASVGVRVYLSTTAGVLTTTIPPAVAGTTYTEAGVLSAADGTTTAYVLLQRGAHYRYN